MVLIHHNLSDRSLRELMGGAAKKVKLGSDDGKRHGRWLCAARRLKRANLSAGAFWTDAERTKLRTAVRALFVSRQRGPSGQHMRR